jgi:Asp-tRNA(Asn)/Glu-tRNA(Gln) amidotransferase A subunit family amidase
VTKAADVITETVPELPFRTVGGALSALASGDIAAAELTEAALRRIEAVNPSIGALREVFAERARRDARLTDEARMAGRSVGSLAGLPIVIKENIDVTPGACTAGLDFLAGRKAVTDAWATATLRAAGAVVLGTAVSDPGAFGVRTAEVRHPKQEGLTVGGSSGGSAAALAAGLCYGALGTDTGGSIRIPASCCGVVGLKPTRGRIPLDGIFPLAWSLDHVGPMAVGVADLLPLAQVLDPKAFQTAPPPRKGVIGYDPGYFADAQPEVLECFASLLERCRDLGYRLREVALPRPADILPMHGTIFACESGAFYLEEFAAYQDRFPAEAQSMFRYLRGLRPQDYVIADRQRTVVRGRVEGAFDAVDFILAPTLPVAAPSATAEGFMIGGQWTDFTYALVRYTALFNHSGHPVLCLPYPAVGGGGSIGVQVVGRLDADADVLTFGTGLAASLDLER